jgi:hypothetical protein
MVLDNDAYMTAWADPNIYFFHGYWSVKQDEALLIEVRRSLRAASGTEGRFPLRMGGNGGGGPIPFSLFWRARPPSVNPLILQNKHVFLQFRPPDCVYWNLQVNNWWMESLDSTSHR